MANCTICDPKCKFNECICNASFSIFDEARDSFIETREFSKFSIIKPWSISTITAVCTFNSKIDVKKYTDFYGHNLTKKKFYNCIHCYIGVKYQSKTKISVKIFANGKMQMAGVLNVKAMAYGFRKIFKRLLSLKAFEDEDEAYISNIKICMINSDFRIDKNIRQSSLCKFFDEKSLSYIKRYSFNPNKYPAINLKIYNSNGIDTTTCLIFRSGSIMITGGNDILEYYKIYNNLLKIINDNDSILIY
jgi:TATA-box binding protein (TBP) (component of TFIID and TFIIIB)